MRKMLAGVFLVGGSIATPASARGQEPPARVADSARAPVAQPLGAVRVTETEDVKHRRYYVNADAIASAKMPLFNALDVVKKLRPDMITGLYGKPESLHPLMTICPAAQSVWVNGERITQAPVNALAEANARRIHPEVFQPYQWRARQQVMSMQSPAPLLLEAILTAIRPEHIAEMKYNDCFEESAKVNQGANSIFITLKPGIGYSRNTGSYVLADGETPAGARAVVSDLASGPVAPYRARLLGLFDDATGAPVEGAEVLDILTGTRGLTSETGTISLAFVTDGGSLIRIQKAGYQPMTMSVMISPVDTVPITLTLAHKN